MSRTPPEMPAASSIVLAAVGGGAALLNGSLELTASGQVLMQAGPAMMALNAEQGASEISILNGMPGSIVLTQGKEPGAPTVVLSEEPAVTLSVGLPGLGAMVKLGEAGITLSYGPPGSGAVMEMNATGVEIKFGLWSIGLTATGIELAVGANRISLLPAAISIDGTAIELASLTDVKVEALLMQEGAAIERTIEAAMTIVE